jgi:hypothetical protein
MHAAVVEKSYTESVGAKVKPEMAAAVRAAAEVAGMKPGEWLRRVIGNALRGNPETRIVLAEVMALGTAILTLQSSEWRGKDFTDEQLKALVDACDARKFAQADKRILAGRSE